MQRKRANALNGLRPPWLEAPLTFQFPVLLRPDLGVYVSPVLWVMSEVFLGVFLVDQPIRLDLLQDGGGDFFDGLGGCGQPPDA